MQTRYENQKSFLFSQFRKSLPVGELFFAQGIGRRYAHSHADVFVAARGFRAEAAPADAELAAAGRRRRDVHFHFAVEGGYAFLRAEYGFPWSQRNLADDIMAVHTEHGMSGIMHGKVKIACRITGIALAAQAELAAVADTGGDGDLEAGSRDARAERDLLGTASASLFQCDVYFGLDVGTATRTARTAAKAAETAKASAHASHTAHIHSPAHGLHGHAIHIHWSLHSSHIHTARSRLGSAPTQGRCNLIRRTTCNGLPKGILGAVNHNRIRKQHKVSLRKPNHGLGAVHRLPRIAGQTRELAVLGQLRNLRTRMASHNLRNDGERHLVKVGVLLIVNQTHQFLGEVCGKHIQVVSCKSGRIIGHNSDNSVRKLCQERITVNRLNRGLVHGNLRASHCPYIMG